MNLALFGFPIPEDTRTPVEVAEWIAGTTSIGAHGGYFMELAEKGRFMKFPYPDKGFPPQLGEPILTTSKPDPSKQMSLDGLIDMVESGQSVLLVFGIGPHGVPKKTAAIPRYNLDITPGGFSLETCTALGAVCGAISARLSLKRRGQFFNRFANGPAMVREARCSHILVDSQQEAYDIYNQINAGANFAQLAMQRSKCPSKYKGGDLGWFGRGQMVKPFEDAAFGYNVGDMTVIQTQFGWHVIYITGQRRDRPCRRQTTSLFSLIRAGSGCSPLETAGIRDRRKWHESGSSIGNGRTGCSRAPEELQRPSGPFPRPPRWHSPWRWPRPRPRGR